MARGRARKRPVSERHVTPHGCQWARNCGNCPWSDCVISRNADLLPYNSQRAAELRRSFVVNMRLDGMALKELGRLLGLHPGAVCRLSRGAPVHRMRTERMVEMRLAGTHEVKVAREFGVTTYAVRKAMREVLGDSGRPWGCHRVLRGAAA